MPQYPTVPKRSLPQKKNLLQWGVTRSNSPKCCPNVSKTAVWYLRICKRTYRIWRIASSANASEQSQTLYVLYYWNKDPCLSKYCLGVVSVCDSWQEWDLHRCGLFPGWGMLLCCKAFLSAKKGWKNVFWDGALRSWLLSAPVVKT